MANFTMTPALIDALIQWVDNRATNKGGIGSFEQFDAQCTQLVEQILPILREHHPRMVLAALYDMAAVCAHAVDNDVPELVQAFANALMGWNQSVTFSANQIKEKLGIIRRERIMTQVSDIFGAKP